MTRAALAAPLLLLLLAGCVPTTTDSPSSTSSPSSSASSTPSASASPTPSASATADPAPIPLTIGCSDLISAQTFYDYNPNYSLLSDYTPDAGTPAATALAAEGIACRWVNQSSGETIDIAAAHLTDKSFASVHSAATAGTATSDFGGDGYFTSGDGVGAAQAFSDPYWVVGTSTAFFEPADAAALISAAITAAG